MKIMKCGYGIICLISFLAFLPLSYGFDNLRFNEPIPEAGSEGPDYKRIELGDAATLSLGGQVRVRGEVWENAGFNAGADDEFALLRLRLHGSLRVHDFRLFVEGKSALITDRSLAGGRRTLDVDALDLQNAFLEYSTDALMHFH